MLVILGNLRGIAAFVLTTLVMIMLPMPFSVDAKHLQAMGYNYPANANYDKPLSKEITDQVRKAATVSPDSNILKRASSLSADNAGAATDEVLVKFKDDAGNSDIVNALDQSDGVVVDTVPQLDTCIVKTTDGQTAEELASSLESNSKVEYVEPNLPMSVYNTVPNDTYYSTSDHVVSGQHDLWGLYSIDAASAWDLQTGSSSVIVAVVDTGLDMNHADIRNNLWTNADEIAGNGIDDDHNGYVDDVNGWDFINNDNNPTDDHGHGTHVSGTIAAVTNNNAGVAGISWNSKIMPLKFLGANGSGYTSDAIEAILYATDNGAKVINNSWGGGGISQTLQDAIDYATTRGTLVVAAAGNSNADAANYSPAGCNNVLTVAALDYNNAKASFSNYGSVVEIAAPGVSILSLRASGTSMGTPLNGSYTTASGTSMACPHVAGIAALLFSQKPDWTPAQVQSCIVNTADSIVPTNIGSGLSNAYAALTSTDTTPTGTRYQQADRSFTWGGSWKITSDSNYSGNAMKYSRSKNAAAKFTFKGTAVTYVATRGSDRGIAKLYIDNELTQTVDLYSPTTSYKQYIATLNGLTNDTHILKVVVSGTKNASSSGLTVDVDACDVAECTDSVAPAPPTLPRGVAGNGKVTLSWNAVTAVDLQGYSVYRSTTEGSGYAKLVDTKSSVRRYVDKSVINSTTYYYTVRAVDKTGNISIDSEDTSVTPKIDPTAPSRPGGFKATYTPFDKVGLKWSSSRDNVGVTGYNIERKTGLGGTWQHVTTETPTAKTYSDTSCDPGSTYYYRISAVDALNNISAYSTTATVNVPVITRYEDTDSAISWASPWEDTVSAESSGGTLKVSSTKDNYGTLTFTGTHIFLVAAKGPNYGVAKIFIDGRFKKNVDLYSATDSLNQAVYSNLTLSSGTHTIRIVVSGNKNRNSASTAINVDSICSGL
jgi:subtilisin family serine protease